MPFFKIQAGCTHTEKTTWLEINTPDEMQNWAKRHLGEFVRNELKKQGVLFPSLFILIDIEITSECFRDCDSYIFELEENIHPVRRPLFNKMGRFLDIHFRLYPFRKLQLSKNYSSYNGYHLEFIVYRQSNNALENIYIYRSQSAVGPVVA